MYRILSILLLTFASLAFTAGKPADGLQFAQKSFDFGSITESTGKVVHKYEFTNTTAEPVAILSVSTGCNCTKATYPVEPIPAGKSGEVTVTFAPQGMVGQVDKAITVRYRGAKARSSKRVTLRLRGNVMPKSK